MIHGAPLSRRIAPLRQLRNGARGGGGESTKHWAASRSSVQRSSPARGTGAAKSTGFQRVTRPSSQNRGEGWRRPRAVGRGRGRWASRPSGPRRRPGVPTQFSLQGQTWRTAAQPGHARREQRRGPASGGPRRVRRSQRPRAQPERGINNNVITSPTSARPARVRLRQPPTFCLWSPHLASLAPPQPARPYPPARQAPVRCPHRSRTAQSSARSDRRPGRTPSPGPAPRRYRSSRRRLCGRRRGSRR